ncbi:8031_t:CDS:1 [Funneliformis geosporum]|uniref:12195_t:CDS:1 n=1 Tax=Funneliformis geosporum TaxID=1117311 RepID=A0A9W4SU84_9GLOM|nr:12195_t:CDS:1 [Funneliformis geosporum]CAI2184997.1 8031_t:CDS:1 [Funneliformis geosporum]
MTVSNINFQIRKFLAGVLLLNPIQIAYSAPARSSKNNWVFWYYVNDGQNRDCANYCILTFSIVGIIILILILCGCWSCYRIKKRSKEDYNDRIKRSESMSEVR